MYKPNDKMVEIIWRKMQGELLSAQDELLYQQWEQHQQRNRPQQDAMDTIETFFRYKQEEEEARPAFLELLKTVQQQERLEKEQQEPEKVMTQEEEHQLMIEIERYSARNPQSKPKVRRLDEAINPTRKVFPFRRIAVAVAILGVVTAGVWLLIINQRPKERQAIKGVSPKPVYKKNVEHLMLTTQTGRQIAFNEAVHNLGTQGGFDILYNNGVVSYNHRPNGIKEVGEVYNTLTTPAGGVLRVQLPDGSVVWMNAASSVTFPVHQDSKERNIILTGEAYFEVAKDTSRPFIVHTGKVQVRAVGTQFLITQSDSAPNKIYLLEGKIKIRNARLSTLVGQPQVWMANDDTLERVTNSAAITSQLIDEVMARQRGVFYFYKAQLKDIVPVLERWYDLELDDRSILSLPDRFHIDSLPFTASFEQFKMALEGSEVIKVSVKGHKLHIEKRK